MPTKRRTLSQQAVIEVLIRQGAKIPCYRCKKLFTLDDIGHIEREHINELAISGDDSLENMGYSHEDCHSVETYGTGATTAGTSIGKAAKIRRITRTGKFDVHKLLAPANNTEREEKPKPKRQWPKQKFPKRIK